MLFAFHQHRLFVSFCSEILVSLWPQYLIAVCIFVCASFVKHISVIMLSNKKKTGGGEVSWCKRGHRQHWKHTKLKPNRLPVSLSWAIIAQWISFRLLKRKTQHQLDQWLWWVRARSWLCIYLFRCVIVVVCACASSLTLRSFRYPAEFDNATGFFHPIIICSVINTLTPKEGKNK